LSRAKQQGPREHIITMPIKAKRISSKRDIARAVDLAARVFSDYYVGVEQWSEVVRVDPGYAPGQTFVVERGGEFVSQVRVTKRRVRLGQQVGLLGGIGDVATDPAHRNRGYASACLREAIRFMQEAGCCLSGLGTGAFSFYRRLGWEIACPSYRVQVSTAGPPPEALDGFGRRRFRMPDDLPSVMALFDAYNAGRLMSVARDEKYWRRQIGFSTKGPAGGPWGYAKEDPDGFIVIIDRAREIVAYARSHHGAERHAVIEIAARDRRAALALLAHLGEQFRHRREIVIDEPPDSLVAEVALADCGGSCTVTRGGKMVRIIDLRLLFELLAPELGLRLRSSELADTAGALRLKTEIGSVAIEWDHGDVGLSRLTKGWRLQIAHRQLAQMITGYRSSQSVLEELGRLGDVEPALGRALAVLFPRRYPHIHVLDRF
jgi:predicted acetyltransferase